MKKTQKQETRRTFERRLARELSSEALEAALGAGGTICCSAGVADD